MNNKKVFKLKKFIIDMKKRIMNKKGEPLSLTYVISFILLGVLAIFVVLFLSGFFKVGEFNPIASDNNIDSHAFKCNTYCEGDFKDSWCADNKDPKVIFGVKDDRNGEWSCAELLAGVGEDGTSNIKALGIKPCEIKCTSYEGTVADQAAAEQAAAE
jgi:hypothetical protein